MFINKDFEEEYVFNKFVFIISTARTYAPAIIWKRDYHLVDFSDRYFFANTCIVYKYVRSLYG